MDERELLRAELFDEWCENHFEHCGRGTLDDGHRCMWPPPPVLGLTVENRPKFEAAIADWLPAYARRR
jgi:hypothetical protein